MTKKEIGTKNENKREGDGLKSVIIIERLTNANKKIYTQSKTLNLTVEIYI